jgi:hypothetical protein
LPAAVKTLLSGSRQPYWLPAFKKEKWQLFIFINFFPPLFDKIKKESNFAHS